MNSPSFTPHVFALCFLFILGNAVFTLPAGSLTFVLISQVLSVVLMCCIYWLVPRLTKQKILFLIFCFIVFVAAALGATYAFWDFYKFLTRVQLPLASHILLFTVLFLTTIIFSLFRIAAIYKYCLFAGIISITIIILCFLSGIKNYDLASIKLPLNEGVYSIKTFVRCFLPIVILPFLFYFKTKNLFFKPILYGTLMGFITLLICCLQTVFTLGNALDEYGYLKAVSVISTGSLFSRLNGLAFFVFFASCMVKITVCIKTASIAIKQLFNKPPSFE